MKKIKFVIPTFTLLLFCITIFHSCKKTSEVYSCNETINQKTIRTISENQNISRYDLAHIEDLEYQMAIFRSLTPENKVRIFNEKVIAEQNNPNLSTGEKVILNQLIAYLQPEHYTTLNSAFQNYAQTQESILRSTYGWDDAKVFVFTNSWMLESEINYLIANKPGTGGGTGGGGTGGTGGGNNYCNCYYSYYCFVKQGFQGSCVDGGCKTPPKAGCGIWGTSNCTGKCEQ